MGYMVIRGEELRRIFLDEIAVLIIENPAVALTGCLLSELLERLADYMELIREYGRDKLFVLVGLRGLFSDEMLERFARTVSDHGYRVLLLDHVEGKKFPMERRLTIDKDLCEF